MYKAYRLLVGVSLFGALVVTTALAEGEDLKKVNEFFDHQDYTLALDTLKKIDRAKLGEADRKAYDDLSRLLPQAIAGQQTAEKDSAAADQALTAGRTDDANRLYAGVIANRFARPALQEHAAQQRQKIQSQTGSVMSSTGGSSSSTALPPPNQPVGQLVMVDGGARPAPKAEPAKPAAPAPSPAPAPAPVQPVQSPTPSKTSGTMQPTAPASGGGSSAAMQTSEPSYSPTPLPPGETARVDIVTDLKRRDELLWQRAVAKLAELSRGAREAVASERFDDARQMADAAVQTIESARGYADPPAKYEVAKAAAAALKQEVADSIGSAEAAKAEEVRVQTATRIVERRAEQERLKREKIDQLFNTARQLRAERRFGEAVETVRQILAIDPGNDKAAYQLDMLEDFASFAEQRELQDVFRRSSRATFVEAEETKIPYPQDVLYPKNWLELSARRAKAGLIAPRSDEDRELNSRLEDRLDDVNLEDTPLEQAVGFLRELKDVNINVDWDDLELNGIRRDRPVSVKLRDVTFKTVLAEVLSQVGVETPLAYTIGDGVLRVASKTKLDRNKFVLVYDIRDLLVDIPKFVNGPVFGGEALAVKSGAPDGIPTAAAGSNNSNLFNEAGPTDLPQPKQNLEIASAVMDIIRTTVEPDSWRELGGGDGALRELNGQLIVYNTSEAHRQVADLLGQLRATRALQISVESRFLVVTQNFLEEIGVDLDFVFNAGNAAYDRAFNANNAPVVDPFTGAPVLIPRQFSRGGAVPAVPAFGTPLAQIAPAQPYNTAGLVPQNGSVIPSFNDTTPIGLGQNSIGITDPTGLNTGVPGSIAQRAGFGPALNIAGSFLDNLQVDFLIRATQANSRSSIVQAPRLVLFNGQRAFVAVARTRAYVASLNPVVAEGAVGVQPIVNAIASGVTLDVEGTIGADRKYVTLTVRTSLAQEPRFERFEVQRSGGAASGSPSLFVLLPDQEIRQISTTVSVPDGGTVLLGGLKQVGEVEVEAGVPILSKIPILKRAFTNTTTVKDTQTLLILLKSKILIQKEAEEEAFPTLSSTGG
ncbi:MAG: hypothetical protein U1D55_05390 [Phycisphaerae bacterium]